MAFDQWYVPGRGTSPNKAQVRISKNLITLSKYTIDEYFKDKQYARIGYDTENNRLMIMPTDELDSLGLKIIGKEESNFYYLNAKNFIANFSLQPEPNKKSIKYDCVWDEENGYLIIENVKK